MSQAAPRWNLQLTDLANEPEAPKKFLSALRALLTPVLVQLCHGLSEEVEVLLMEEYPQTSSEMRHAAHHGYGFGRKAQLVGQRSNPHQHLIWTKIFWRNLGLDSLPD